MKITIEKRNASIGYDFLVLENAVPILSAVSEKLFIFYKISMWNISDNKRSITIKNKKLNFFFRPGYWVYYKGEKFEFKTISYYKRHFQLELNDELYEIYGHHRSWKYSVFKNNEQVAWWDKQTQKHQGPDVFNLEMNDDFSIELITSFCLILDDHIDMGMTYRGDFFNTDLSMNLDYKMYGEIKSFDENWKANIKTDRTFKQ